MTQEVRTTVADYNAGKSKCPNDHLMPGDQSKVQSWSGTASQDDTVWNEDMGPVITDVLVCPACDAVFYFAFEGP